MVQLALIAAMGRNREIGLGNRLLWKLPDDMKFFRQHTLSKSILVARKTWESFGSRPLPDRRNIVLTREHAFDAPGAELVHDIDAAIALVDNEEELMVIGGASLYEQMLPMAKRLYLTLVDADFEADSFFPEIDFGQWQEIYRQHHPIDERHQYAFDFIILEREQT